MKKIITIIFLLTLLFIPANVYAGPQCDEEGGICRAARAPCNNNESSVGKLDCPGTGAGGQKCCVPKVESDPIDPTCTPSGGGDGIDTAIGCIPVGDTNQFMGWILGWAVGVGGGIAFLLIVYASFMIMTSQGVPDRLKAGQELLTSAISGLIMLIFSVFILKFIGIDILGLGDFGFGQTN